MIVVVDASVALKWVVTEDGSDQANRFFDPQDTSVLTGDAGDRVLASPDFVLVEVANVLWKKTRRSEVTSSQGADALSHLTQLFDRLIPTVLLHDSALRIALMLDHPVCDCIYLACAEAVDGVLVSADRKFLERCRARGLGGRVRNLSGGALH